MERLRKKILLKLSVGVEVSLVESNETTAATVSCDLAPPPQRRRRRRHPPPSPPRNILFVTLPLLPVGGAFASPANQYSLSHSART